MKFCFKAVCIFIVEPESVYVWEKSHMRAAPFLPSLSLFPRIYGEGDEMVYTH